MGNCPGTMIGSVSGVSPTVSRTAIPFELQSLRLAYEPVDIFRLLGFDRPGKVTPEEFAARIRERINLLNVKRGGGLDNEDMKDVRNWLDTEVSDKTNITEDELAEFCKENELKVSDVKDYLRKLKKKDQNYRDIEFPDTQKSDSGSSQKGKAPEECRTEDLKTWIKNLENPSLITQEDIDRSGLSRTTLQICFGFLKSDYPGISFKFAPVSDRIPKTSACYRILNEAAQITSLGKKKDLYKTFLRYTTNRTNLTPSRPVTAESFVDTCKQIEDLIPTGYNFPVSMLGYVILREAINPFAVLGLDIDSATLSTVTAQIKSRRALLNEDTSRIKQYTNEFKTSCSKGLDELESILKANLFDNLKKYVKSRLTLGLYPPEPLLDGQFQSLCLNPAVPKAEPTPPPKSEPVPEPTPPPSKPEPVPKPIITCTFKVNDKVKRIETGDSYGKQGVVQSLTINGTICSTITVKYEDSTTETNSPIYFKLLSRETCPFKVGDTVKSKASGYSGEVLELNFLNENDEEQDECQTVKLKYTIYGDTRIENVKDLQRGFAERYRDFKNLFESFGRNIPNPFKKKEGPQSPPNKQCLASVRTWLENPSITKSKITYQEYATIADKVSLEQLKQCLQYFNSPSDPIGFDESSVPKSPNKKCNTLVTKWLSKVKNVNAITIDEVKSIIKKGISFEELRECVDYINALKFTNIQIPEPPPEPTPPPPEPTPNSRTSDGSYFQKQEGLGCGRHALNNLFGETLFVKGKRTDTSLEGPPYSLFAICKDQEERVRQLDPESIEPCLEEENYDTGVLQRALEVLGYIPEQQGLYESNKDVEIRKEPNIDDSVIGVLINKGPAGQGTLKHWVALRRIDTTDQYTVVDSLRQGPGPTTKLDEFLFPVPREQNPIRAYILVKRKPRGKCEAEYPELYNALKSGKYNENDILQLINTRDFIRIPIRTQFYNFIGYDAETRTIRGVKINKILVSCHPDKNNGDENITRIAQILNELNSRRGGRRTYRRRGARKTKRHI